MLTFPARRRRAFTLIELLVVISIIAILLGLLLPALSRARYAARAAASVSNMHQIAVGLTLYAGENKQYLPTIGDTGYTWMEHLGLPAINPANADVVESFTKFVSDPKAFRSPTDESGFFDKPDSNGDLRHTSYGYNGTFSYELPPYFGVRLDQANVPSSTILLAEYNDLQAWDDHFHPQFFGYDPAHTGSPQSIAMGFVDPANLLYPLDVFNTLIANGATQGSSGVPYIDNSDDAAASWDSARKVPKILAFDRYNHKGLYGFADGHAQLHAFAQTFTWNGYNAASFTTPEVNWFDPKGQK
jgi:prepilin-type N-terminal cleavage/methylation domain-containing protein